jgi:hypothetical protein
MRPLRICQSTKSATALPMSEITGAAAKNPATASRRSVAVSPRD